MDSKVVATRLLPADEPAVEQAVHCLRAGGLVAFPTETVYGLGADAANGAAIARLYAAKGRPAFNPLIAHVHDIDAARRLGIFDRFAERLAEALWPGPLTLVMPQTKTCTVAVLATAGLDTIAVRVPAQRIARDLLRNLGGPIVAPSANRSGHVSPTMAAHVMGDLDGRIDMIIDGGPTEVGLESTIVACLGGAPTLLRSGGVPRAAIEAVLGTQVAVADAAQRMDDVPIAPGQLRSHYAPRTPVRLDAGNVQPGEALLAFGHSLPPGADTATAILNLSDRSDLVEAAANLFSHLRVLDTSGARAIAVMPVSDHGLGEAINDRLRRAAAPR